MDNTFLDVVTQWTGHPSRIRIDFLYTAFKWYTTPLYQLPLWTLNSLQILKQVDILCGHSWEGGTMLQISHDPITTGKANSKIYEIREDTRNILVFGIRVAFAVILNIIITNTYELTAI